MPCAFCGMKWISDVYTGSANVTHILNYSDAKSCIFPEPGIEFVVVHYNPDFWLFISKCVLWVMNAQFVVKICQVADFKPYINTDSFPINN